MQFDCAVDNYQIWVNNELKGTFNFWSNVPDIDTFEIYTSTSFSRGNFRGYIDALDYSWAPGYYTNRNMEHYAVDYSGRYHTQGPLHNQPRI